jgi:hypothetical protein
MVIVVFAVVIGWLNKKWWDDYKDIPIDARKEYIVRWKETKSGTGESKQVQNGKELMFSRKDRDEILKLLHEINNRLAYQKSELAYQWWWSLGLSFVAIGMGALSISITWRTETPVAFQWFWPGFLVFVVGAIIILSIGGYTIYSACKRFSTKKKKFRSNS